MRADPRMRRRYATMAGYLGVLWLIGAGVALLPLAWLPWSPAEVTEARPFVELAAVLGLGGLGLLTALPRGERPALSISEAGIVIVAGWALVACASAWPLLRLADLTAGQAIFEAMSGWTTTGLSVVDVLRVPRIVLLWRSIMQLAGGAGMAVVLLAVLGSPLGPGLAFAEGRADKLAPSVRRSSLVVLSLYGVYLVGGTVGLRAVGMGAFDAVNHAMCAVSTGGFSTQPESIGHYRSLAVELVTIPLMLAGSTNFHTMWWALAGRRGLHRSPELRVAVAALALAIPALLFALGSRGGETSGLRIAVFETVSALTTTGFSITSYRGWPSTAVLSLVVLMIVGGGTGSTAGGVKQLRVYLLMRSLVWEIQRALAPSRALRVLTIERGGFRERVEPDALVQANVVLVMYLFCLIGLMATMTAYGYSLADALFESASTLSTVGLSVGVTSPDTPAPVLAMQTVGMLLGRLELVIVATALVRGLRDGIDMLRTRAA